MEHPTSPAAGALAAIAHLQQRVQAWMDEDRLFPADGSSLLAALDRALVGLASEDAPAARAALEACVGRVQALIEARVLAAEDGEPPIARATAIAASLPSGVETDLETQRRPGESDRG